MMKMPTLVKKKKKKQQMKSISKTNAKDIDNINKSAETSFDIEEFFV